MQGVSVLRRARGPFSRFPGRSPLLAGGSVPETVGVACARAFRVAGLYDALLVALHCLTYFLSHSR